MLMQIFNKYVFLLLFFFALSGSAFAGDKSGEASAQDAEVTCTKNDLRAIKSYNSKIRRKIKDYNELVASAPETLTDRDAKEFTEDAKKLIKFFTSDEFTGMEEVYKRCDMVIPRPMAKQSFWIPEDKRIYYGAM